jgi:hypothetical protein
MAETFIWSAQLDPDLAKAFTRYQEVLTAATQDAQLLMNSFNPLQSFQQISDASLAFYKGLDWLKIAQNAWQPDSFFTYLDGLKEIQAAASEQLANGQNTLLDSVCKDSQALTQRLAAAQSPAQLLADTINSGLDTYADIKTNLTQQSQTLASIQSAIVAFQQQSLSELNGEVA